jgi:predicted aminopeptidase
MILKSKEKLAELYKQNLPDNEMLMLKNKLFNELQEEYQQLKEKEWNNYQGYDRWFEEMNNAKLLSVAMYEEYVPAFKKLFENNNRDFKQFYEEIRKLAALPKHERHQYLLELSNR